jgi:hypothetical protein
MAPALRLFDILQVLGRHGVDFILVGGVAAVLEGAPVATFDLDVVPDPAPENRGRLLEALRELNARYLDLAGRHFVPDEAKLASMRLHQLLTDAGPLDVLTTIGAGMTYSDLTGRTRQIEVAGHRFRCLKLDAIIESKEQADREKDRAALPILRRTLQQKLKSAKPD